MGSKIFLLAVCSLFLQCHCYGPPSLSDSAQPPVSDTNVITYSADNNDYGLVKSLLSSSLATQSSPQAAPTGGHYWWQNVPSPFISEPACATGNCSPSVQVQVTSDSGSKVSTTNGITGVIYESNPFLNGFFDKKDQLGGYGPVVTSTGYPVVTGDYSKPDIVPVTSNSIAPSTSPPYQGPLASVSPYPGCPAALKCVPENYCTAEGVASDKPVELTNDFILNRVPLTDCLDVATGIVGKCCRDPNYKDPWPEDLPHEHEHEHTDSNIIPTDIQYKPTPGYPVPSSTENVIPISAFQPSTEAPNLNGDYGGVSNSNSIVPLPPNNYGPSAPPYQPPSTTYIPPTYPSPPSTRPPYNPPKPPPSTYVPPPSTYYPTTPPSPPTQSPYQPPKPTFVPQQPSQPPTYFPPSYPSYGPSYKPPVISQQPLQPPYITGSQNPITGYPVPSQPPFQPPPQVPSQPPYRPPPPSLPPYKPPPSQPPYQPPQSSYPPSLPPQPSYPTPRPTTPSPPPSSTAIVPSQPPYLTLPPAKPSYPPVTQPPYSPSTSYPTLPPRPSYPPPTQPPYSPPSSQPAYPTLPPKPSYPPSTQPPYSPSPLPPQQPSYPPSSIPSQPPYSPGPSPPSYPQPPYSPGYPSQPSYPLQPAYPPQYPQQPVYPPGYPPQQPYPQQPGYYPLQPQYPSQSYPQRPYSAPEIDSSPPTIVKEYSATCGVRKNDGTPYGAAPWHAIVYSNKNKDLICAGAIVSENAVLTTAHCLDHSEAETTEVKIGPEGKVYKVAAIARHSKYDPVSFSRDLALVVLKEPIEFNEYVEKICLPTSFTQLHSYNRDCYVSTLAKEFEPNTLQTIPVQVFTYKDCEVKLRNTYLGKYFILNDSFSCVSTPAEAELCLVKTGSPIACDKGDGTFELFGIKSWDLGCQEYKKSAVFSNFDVIWVQTTLASPITKLIAEEKARQKDKFKGDTLEGINIQDKPGFALGYGK